MRGEIRSAGWVWEQTLLMACGLRLDLSTGCVCSPKWILRGRHTGDSPPSHRDSVTLNSPPFPGPPLVRACFNRGAIYGIVTVSRRSSDTSSAALQAGLTCHSRYRPSRYYRPPSFSSRALPLSRAGGKSSKYLASTLNPDKSVANRTTVGFKLPPCRPPGPFPYASAGTHPQSAPNWPIYPAPAPAVGL